MKKLLFIVFTLLGFANNFAFGAEISRIDGAQFVTDPPKSYDIITNYSDALQTFEIGANSAIGAINYGNVFIKKFRNLSGGNLIINLYGNGYDGNFYRWTTKNEILKRGIEYIENYGHISFKDVSGRIGYVSNFGTIGFLPFITSHNNNEKHLYNNSYNTIERLYFAERIYANSPAYSNDGIPINPLNPRGYYMENRGTIKKIEISGGSVLGNDIMDNITVNIYNDHGTIGDIVTTNAYKIIGTDFNNPITSLDGKFQTTIHIVDKSYSTIGNITKNKESNNNVNVFIRSDGVNSNVSDAPSNLTIGNISNYSNKEGTMTININREKSQLTKVGNIFNNGTMDLQMNTIKQGITYSTSMGYISNNGTMTMDMLRVNAKDIYNNGDMTANISSGRIDSISNNNGTMTANISGSISKGIDNKGKMNLHFGGTIYNLALLPNNDNRYYHIGNSGNANITIDSYTFEINESADKFNNFSGYTAKSSSDTTSHLVIHNSSDLSFKISKNAPITIYARPENVELNNIYFLNKFFTDALGNSLTEQIGYEWLAENIELYYIFGSNLKMKIHEKDGKLYGIEFYKDSGGSSSGGNQGGGNNNNQISANIINPNDFVGQWLYKSNIKAMNNLYINSNSMIFKHKHSNKAQPKRRIAMNFPQDSGESIKENALFYRSYPQDSHESMELYSAYNPKKKKSNKSTNPKSANFATNNSQSTQSLYNNDKYHFAFVPFVSHSIFNESGGYNLSGFDYGFITAFSGMIGSNNALGVHFGISNGKLQNKNTDSLNITSLNLMGGLNYKLDLIYDMYIKMRGDVFYFMNDIEKSEIIIAKPTNLGFGASVAYGKDFDFKAGGVLGLEIGIDYKGLNNGAFSTKSIADDSNSKESYEKSLYNMLYADLGISYHKYFDFGFGFSVGGGFRANLMPKLATGGLIINGTHYDMTIDNDKYIGYASAGIGYILSNKSNTMEFSLNYNGNFGDKAMNNAGMFDFRVLW